jgi:hypothetical protein
MCGALTLVVRQYIINLSTHVRVPPHRPQAHILERTCWGYMYSKTWSHTARDPRSIGISITFSLMKSDHLLSTKVLRTARKYEGRAPLPDIPRWDWTSSHVASEAGPFHAPMAFLHNQSRCPRMLGARRTSRTSKTDDPEVGPSHTSPYSLGGGDGPGRVKEWRGERGWEGSGAR